jgi:hypothetical protein
MFRLMGMVEATMEDLADLKLYRITEMEMLPLS